MPDDGPGVVGIERCERVERHPFDDRIPERAPLELRELQFVKPRVGVLKEFFQGRAGFGVLNPREKFRDEIAVSHASI